MPSRPASPHILRYMTAVVITNKRRQTLLKDLIRVIPQVLDNDFFLVACRSEFIENTQLSIFETFCRVHQC